MEADMGQASRIAEKNAKKIERAFSGMSNAIKAGLPASRSASCSRSSLTRV